MWPSIMVLVMFLVRYEMLRKLYESHSLAKEIVQKRSTSDRVVVNNYY